METLQYRTVDSPVGKLTLAGRGQPAAASTHGRIRPTSQATRGGSATTIRLPDAVAHWRRTSPAIWSNSISRCTWSENGVSTPRVGSARLTIPYGQTRSYGEIALQSIAQRFSRSRVGQWPQSDRHHRAVPSRHRSGMAASPDMAGN